MQDNYCLYNLEAASFNFREKYDVNVKSFEKDESAFNVLWERLKGKVFGKRKFSWDKSMNTEYDYYIDYFTVHVDCQCLMSSMNLVYELIFAEVGIKFCH